MENAEYPAAPPARWWTAEDFKSVAVFLASAASNCVDGSICLVGSRWMER